MKRYFVPLLAFAVTVMASGPALPVAPPTPTPTKSPPPRYIQVSVRAALQMLQGHDDASIEAFMNALMVPAKSRTRSETIASLRELRRTVQPLLGNVVLKPDSDGVVLVLSGDGKTRRVHMVVNHTGVHKLELMASDAEKSKPATKKDGKQKMGSGT